MDQPFPRYEIRTRSLAKSITYRILIIALDLAVLYLFTGNIGVTVGFTIISNVYTALAYYGHERLWQRVRWGVTGGAS